MHRIVSPHLRQPKPSNYRNAGRKALDSRLKLALALRFLATGESQRSLSIQFRLSRSVVNKLLKETLKAIYKGLHSVYLPPPTKSKWQQLAADFEKNWQMPFCTGAVDGKHCQLDCPNLSGSQYFNYKVKINQKN